MRSSSHARPGADPLWGESFYFDLATADGLGAFLRLGVMPGLRTAWLWACLAGEDRPVVLVRDHEVPVPRPGTLEVRAEGLWADLICETPGVHWTLGLEAFGVALDDPLDALVGERGSRTPLGLDLEWEAAEAPFEHPAPRPVDEGHVQHRGEVHGEILVGSERFSVAGAGQFDHFWGVRDWWGTGWHWAACRVEPQGGGDSTTVSVARPARPGPEHATGYLTLGADDPHPITFAEVTTEWESSGLPARVHYRLEDEFDLAAEVVAPVPMALPDVTGDRVAHLHRGLCRFTSSRGDGVGWAEWLVPAPDRR